MPLKKPHDLLIPGVLLIAFTWNGILMSNVEQQGRSDAGTNRLAGSSSPYLLQHKDNPVDWFPWGPEAFEKAAREDKPVFLSIGYSTCHWCHVMAHESFEDPEVARLMNDAFVSIKVDREERPDIDGIYMSACHMITGSGGWPLTIIMTPDQKPFFVGTYIPKTSRYGRTGMMELVPRIKEIWEKRRDEVDTSADRITEALRQMSDGGDGGSLGPELLDRAHADLAARFDEEHGGFGRAPKFPTPHVMLFLLRHAERTGDGKALAMVEKTLEAMRRGGMYDHLGFGFHRYSTDREWRVPHFEKMLYDQAQLALLYVEGYQATGKAAYRRTAEEIFEYVLRDMTAPDGGFYSAEDADSEGEEGKFYLWSEDEIRSILDEDDADLVVRLFNVEKGGNFLEEATRHRTGTNILFRTGGLDEIAAELEIPSDRLGERIERAREKLFVEREKRIHPGKDDKILLSWNGLMISALARGAVILQEPRYSEAARRAADFVLTRMRTGKGRLLRRFRAGEAGITAQLEDYAFFTAGLIDLYGCTFDAGYLKEAVNLNRQMIDHFVDAETGGFFATADDGEKLITRRMEADDGATPSGNSMAMVNLIRLGRMLGSAELEDLAAKTGGAFSKWIERSPSAFTHFMVALDLASGPSQELVIVGRREADDTQAMLRAVSSRFLPRLVVLFRDAGAEEGGDPVAELAPFTKPYAAIDGKATAYVCSGFQCEQPVTDPGEMMRLLEGDR